MINNVVLVGRVTKELDLRYTPAGKAVARFNLAVNRDFKDANGDQMIMLIVQAVNSIKGITNKILVAIINQLIHSIALVSLLILVMMTFHSEKGGATDESKRKI